MLNIDDFVTRFRDPKRNGTGYSVCCPTHNDKKQSLSISPGDNGGIVLKCFAGCETKDILRAVDCDWKDIQPEKERDIKRDNARQNGSNGKAPTIKEVYQYHDADGYLVFEVVRMEPKDFRQRVRKPDGSFVYSTKGIKKPLYRLPNVLEAERAGERIFYCEGEKDVHAVEALGFVATTHCGGAEAWKNNPQYVETLKGAKLYILKDNDTAGQNMAIAIRKDLPQAEIVRLPGLKDKGDVSDWIANGGTAEQLEQIIHDLHNAPAREIDSTQYFRCLGYNCDRYYFLPNATKQIKCMAPADLGNKMHLYSLAPMEHWESSDDYQDCEARNGRDYSRIGGKLMRMCVDAGIYSDDMRRGMGAWIDDGRTVLHTGDALSVDGVHTELIEIKSRYVYEARGGNRIVEGKPISDSQANAFLDICAMPYWEDEIYGQLLAGWIACAPICGTLKWRPHIWINGPAGCGKSYIATNIVGKALRGVIRQFASSTTEAGIRQKLASDSLPVLFDEAEGDTRGSRENINRILELMRHSSSDSDALITKGSSGGVATDFAIRSMFCMSSIAHGINRRADESRTTILRLKDSTKRPNADEAFKALGEAIAMTITPDFAAGFVARACQHAQVMRHNAETFSAVLSGTDGGRRYGDQIGTMLAAYITLRFGVAWPRDVVEDYIASVNLDALSSNEMHKGKDEEQCLNFLLQQHVRVDHKDKTVTYTVGELVELAAKHNQGEEHATLKRIGMAIKDGKLLVSNSHDGLSKLFRNSPYGDQWATYLKTLPGANVSRGTYRFGGSSTRFVTLEIPND